MRARIGSPESMGWPWDFAPSGRISLSPPLSVPRPGVTRADCISTPHRPRVAVVPHACGGHHKKPCPPGRLANLVAGPEPSATPHRGRAEEKPSSTGSADTSQWELRRFRSDSEASVSQIFRQISPPLEGYLTPISSAPRGRDPRPRTALPGCFGGPSHVAGAARLWDSWLPRALGGAREVGSPRASAQADPKDGRSERLAARSSAIGRGDWEST